MIGTFGNIVFETSADKVLTFDGFVRKGSAQFAEHPVIDGKTKLQHTGDGLDEVSFSVKLSASLGVNPSNEIEKLREIKAAGDPKKLIMGMKVIGDFVLTSVEDAWDRVDNLGNIFVSTVNLTLKEYVNGN